MEGKVARRVASRGRGQGALNIVTSENVPAQQQLGHCKMCKDNGSSREGPSRDAVQYLGLEMESR